MCGSVYHSELRTGKLGPVEPSGQRAPLPPGLPDLAGAPHPTFDHFATLLDRLREVGGQPLVRPHVEDITPSSTAATELMAALRWLGLANDEERATTDLVRLARSEDRVPLFRRLAEVHYPTVVSLLTAGTTRDNLAEAFGGDRSGKTLERAITFFLSLAKKGEVPGADLKRRARRRDMTAVQSPRVMGDDYEAVLLDAMRGLAGGVNDDATWLKFIGLADRLERLRSRGYISASSPDG